MAETRQAQEKNDELKRIDPEIGNLIVGGEDVKPSTNPNIVIGIKGL